MKQTEIGGYVEYADYARLKAEVERSRDQYNGIIDTQLKVIEELKAEVERLKELNATISLRYDATKSMLDGCAKEIEEMEAEVERLTKAGDAMAARLMYQGYPETVPAWNAAKKGE